MITHYMKDGKVLKDISGHVVRMEDAKVVYSLLDKINQAGVKESEEGNDRNS